MSVITEIFEEFHKVRNTIEVPIDVMQQELEKYKGKVCLYGAGSAGIAFLYYLRRIDVEPCCFIDGNPKRCGEYCEGIKIVGAKEAYESIGGEALVIVTINTDGKRYCKSFSEELRRGGHTAVHKSLRDVGFENVIDYTYFRRCHELFQGDPYNLPSCSDVNIMEQNQNKIEKVYGYLADDLSREVYEKILYFRLIDDSIAVPTISQNEQYFERDIYKPSKEEVFVDCGAFNGISLQTFLKKNKGVFSYYYGFEPDKTNFVELKSYVDGLPLDIRNKISIYNKAVYDSEGGVNLYELQGPGSFVADIGKTKAETVTIDKVIGGSKVSLIKMNIEGSELKALDGARGSIINDKPKLAIAGYHKTWDLWEIPLKILRIRGDYRFYLRSYMNHISFVYYGV